MNLVKFPLTLALLIGAVASADAGDGRNAAFAGGAAAGVVGGVLLNQALQNNEGAPPAPAYDAPRYARPAPVYDAPRYDPMFDRLQRLRDACDDGNRSACIRFGVMLGENRERERQWRNERPDFYRWERG
jgi:hypothetical protein